jgi:chromosome segregation ATPase
MKMKYGLDGQMIVTTQCEPWATDQDQPDTAEHIKILATEIELLTAELEEEKSAAKVQQRECGEHVHKLRTAEQELSSCQEALNTSEWEVNRVRVEMKEKTGELATVKGELLGCKQYVEQLAAEKHTSASVQKQGKHLSQYTIRMNN